MRLLLYATLLGCLLMVPMSAAHTTVTTADGKYFVTVGNLNEPVSTFTKTGLDLTIRANNSGERGAGINGAHLTLNATLQAPGGQEFSEPLEPRFGVQGGYSYGDPYYLTQPGEYFLRMNGRINETQVTDLRVLVGSGPIPAIEGLHFPDEVSSIKQLEDRIAALEADNRELEDRLAEMEGAGNGGSAPGIDVASLLVLFALAAFFVARRRAA